MSAALKRFDKYQPSAVRWVDDVPIHWRSRRIKTFLREVDQRSGTGEGALLTMRRASGLVPLSDFSDKITEPERLGRYKLASPGQIVMNPMQAGNGMFAICHTPGLISPDYRAFELTDEADARYLIALFKSEAMRATFRAESKGLGTGTAGFLRLYPERFGSLFAPFPPPEEQRRIADFLDAYTAQVHRLIAAKRRTIALWNEARLAKIAFVLGAGSAADAQLTGGPEWWSSVPDGWSVARFRSLLRTKSGDMIDGADEVAEGIPIYGGNGIRGYAPKANTTGPILLLGRVGAKCGCVHFVEGPLWASEHALRVYPKIDIDLQYLRLVLELTDLNRYAISTAQPLITGRIVGEQTTLLAPRDLQQGLAAQAIAQAAEVDDAIAKLLAEIDLILEYRDSLIAAVVTGQLDVRDAAIPVVEGDDFANDTATDDENMEDALDAVD
jgi:type I restriction enzyme S subunit